MADHVDRAIHAPPLAEQFEDLEKQRHAARLGMWVFLASEVLLFAGLFALYAAYRAMYPASFGGGVANNSRILGSVNTVVLITSSYTVASSVHALRHGERRHALRLLFLTVLGAIAFLVIKGVEYTQHFREGVFPGGAGRYFVEHAEPGLPSFYTLYFLMTGLHALHVIAGMSVLTWLAFKVYRRTVSASFAHPLELGAAYWHLVDVVWIFLWPLFYLTPEGAP